MPSKFSRPIQDRCPICSGTSKAVGEAPGSWGVIPPGGERADLKGRFAAIFAAGWLGQLGRRSAVFSSHQGVHPRSSAKGS